MLIVETIGRIRREHLDKGKSIKEIARGCTCLATRYGGFCDRARPRFPTNGRFSGGQSSDDGRTSSIGCWRRTRKPRRANV
jgi:hypothetical protein